MNPDPIYILGLIAEGHYQRSENDRYIICENPDFEGDNGKNPCVVYDLYEGMFDEDEE